MADFWAALPATSPSSAVGVGRPRGSVHPRHPELVYPLDYGVLDGSAAGDGHGVDIFVGTGGPARLTGVVLTADLSKRDTELKLLGCTPDDLRQIWHFLSQLPQLGGTVLARPATAHRLGDQTSS